MLFISNTGGRESGCKSESMALVYTIVKVDPELLLKCSSCLINMSMSAQALFTVH